VSGSRSGSTGAARRGLGRELRELERTDPKVAKAAAGLDALARPFKAGERVCIMRGGWDELRGTWAVIIRTIPGRRAPDVLVIAPDEMPGKWIALCADEVNRGA
jgi:hypothetical protein